MIHICTDCWTDGVPELAHEVAKDFNLHPPEVFHPLVQVRDTARHWMGLGIEIFSRDLGVTDRHLYLTRAADALMILHAGDLSSPLFKENGGVLEPDPETGPFGLAATFSWNVAWSEKIPRISLNIMREGVSQAHQFVAECLSEFRAPYGARPFRLAISGPTERYAPREMRSWLTEFYISLASHADPRHAYEYEYEVPLLARILGNEKDAKKAFGMPESKPVAIVAPKPKGVGRPTIGRPQKTPIEVVESVPQVVPPPVSQVVPSPVASVGKPSVGKAPIGKPSVGRPSLGKLSVGRPTLEPVQPTTKAAVPVRAKSSVGKPVIEKKRKSRLKGL